MVDSNHDGGCWLSGYMCAEWRIECVFMLVRYLLYMGKRERSQLGKVRAILVSSLVSPVPVSLSFPDSVSSFGEWNGWISIHI